MIEKGYSKSTKIDGKYVDVIDRTTLTEFLKKELGHEIQSKVTKTTNFLINIDTTSNSSKNQDAKKLDVAIIAPEEILTKIREKSNLLNNDSEKKIEEEIEIKTKQKVFDFGM